MKFNYTKAQLALLKVASKDMFFYGGNFYDALSLEIKKEELKAEYPTFTTLKGVVTLFDYIVNLPYSEKDGAWLFHFDFDYLLAMKLLDDKFMDALKEV